MSYTEMQLSPQGSTRVVLRIAVQDPRCEPTGISPELDLRPAYAGESDEYPVSKRDTILGLLILVGFSASFWTGVGMMLARFWK